jgi:hypothetical protein
MQTTFSLSPQEFKASEDRETFSHQTLILTALTAINSPNNHPIFNGIEVNKERLRCMKERITHTRIIDAATAILITDTEILATMARGANTAHSIVAIKEIMRKDQESDSQLHDDLLQVGKQFQDLDPGASDRVLGEIDGLIPGELHMAKSVTDEGHRVPADDVFVSFPNINKAIPFPMQEQLPIDSVQQSSTSHGPICTPIATVNGHWTQIMESKKGFIFESTK